MIKSGDLFELGRLPFANLDDIDASFDNLPEDSYAEDRLRSRRYSRFKYKDRKLERQQQQDFVQSKDINKAVGDVERKYEEVEDNLLDNDIFLCMFEEFQTRAELDPESIIEAHQIRWHCKRRIKAPAPEGRHQDGFDFIAIYMIKSHNVDGGETILYETADDAPIFKRNLEDGEFIILNDKKLYHNAAPLVPTANQDDGHWDVIVLTAHNAA